MAIAISPALGTGRTYTPVTVGQQVTFSATGGTAPYIWSSTGGIINSSTGLFTATEAGSVVITVTDSTAVTPLTATRNVTVGTQSQICAEFEEVVSAVETEPCCEFNVECGKTLQLRIPSFHLRLNDRKVDVDYKTLSASVEGDYASLRSNAADGYALANDVDFSVTNALAEIVTNYDMAQTGNGEFLVEWDDNLGNVYSIAWLTTSSVRYFEFRVNGVLEAGSKYAVQQGDLISFGKEGDAIVVYLNNQLHFTSAETLVGCGVFTLVVRIATANKTVGGYLTNLTWEITTSGTEDQVGAIDGNGLYISPDSPISGIVNIVGTIGSAAYTVTIKNIKPSYRYTQPNAFLANRKASVWVRLYKSGESALPDIASDASPDAISGKWIDLGTLEGSASFAEDIQRQDFEDDEGIYYTGVTGEKAMLKGSFTQVRDFDKLARLMQHATYSPLNKGKRSLSVGGKICGQCELAVLLIAEPQNCEEGFDAIYMPRVQNRGNLNLEIGKKTNGKYEFDFNVLLDRTLPYGSQLYTIYQIEGCNTITANVCN